MPLIPEVEKLIALKKTKGTATEYDASIGQRVRMQRSFLGWSQEKLADALGITFQQVQKYENGTNRIAAGRLFEIAQIMGVSVASFYADIINNGSGFFSDTTQDTITNSNDPAANEETMDLLRAYYAIKDPAIRKQFVSLAKSIAKDLQKSAKN